MFPAHARDYSSFEELVGTLHTGLLNGVDNAGFHVDLSDMGKEVIHSQLMTLASMGVFSMKAEPGILETQQDLIDKDAKMKEEDLKLGFPPEESDEEEELASLYEKRGYLECYMKKSLYQKLQKLNPNEFLVHSYEYRFGYTNRPTDTIPIRKAHFKNNISIETATNPDYPPFWLTQILQNTSVVHKQNILIDLYHVYIIDKMWHRPTVLFDTLIETLK